MIRGDVILQSEQYAMLFDLLSKSNLEKDSEEYFLFLQLLERSSQGISFSYSNHYVVVIIVNYSSVVILGLDYSSLVWIAAVLNKSYGSIEQVVEAGIEVESSETIQDAKKTFDQSSDVLGKEDDGTIHAYNMTIPSSKLFSEITRMSLLSVNLNSDVIKDALENGSVMEMPEKYVIRKGNKSRR